MINSSWPMNKVGDLFEVQLGKMLNKRAKEGLQFPYLANFNIRWGAIDFSRLNEMSFSEIEQEKFSLEKGDLLMCEGGEIGRCAIWKDSDREIYYQKALHRLRPISNNITTEFMYFYMQYIATKGTLPKLVGETSIAHLTREKLLSLNISVPKLEEQIAITDLLNTWEVAIGITDKLINCSQERKNALMQLLLTGNKRFPEFHKTNWKKEVNLGSVFKERKEKNCIDLPLLSITREEGVIPREKVGRKDSSSKDKSKYLKIYSGDIGYNTMRMWQGVSAMSSYEGIISPAYTVLIPDSSVDAEFMSYLFKLPSVVHRFERFSQGLTSDTWNLKYCNFSKVKVSIPDIEEQMKIAQVLRDCDQEIQSLIQLLDIFKQQKKGLMQLLLTGKKRVTTF